VPSFWARDLLPLHCRLRMATIYAVAKRADGKTIVAQKQLNVRVDEATLTRFEAAAFVRGVFRGAGRPNRSEGPSRACCLQAGEMTSARESWHAGETSGSEPKFPVGLFVAWLSFVADLIALTVFWLLSISIVVKVVATTVLFLGLCLIVAFYLGQVYERKRLGKEMSPHEGPEPG
jgi:hypothetical protein